MKPKLLLCLALVLSGGLFGCSSFHQTNKNGGGWEWENSSVRKVKFTEAELVGTYRMPISSDRYVWLGRGGWGFLHFGNNRDAWINWTLYEGALIAAQGSFTNQSADFGNFTFFRPVKTSGSGMTNYNSLKFERHSIALLRWGLQEDPPKKLGDLWFLRDSNTNYVFINNCGTNTLQNQNPTEAEIHAAIFALDVKKGESHFSFGPTPMIWMQATGDPKVGFKLDYQECKPSKEYFQEYRHYEAKGKFAADEVVKVLVSYLNSSDDWKKTADWKQPDESIQ
jgi:hypothetical protein